ncbi:uncharacterized protein BDR25DRAFT_370506 [Lindgomyces ingoldianus]|uniref:Uncharacterized protein n=1 Tax=Lindgomyces ingoldianus TaxID=673940 RepID=A0ACB6QTG0_9PLEO|nr:uncharacterized protein BDR25DRAFT_370506 [Lindgomyces ingoldianus]KAF2469853.1 hypothetical protein BDR25DRAFT_370506 [Lindgomyces ingoldianus]
MSFPTTRYTPPGRGKESALRAAVREVLCEPDIKEVRSPDDDPLQSLQGRDLLCANSPKLSEDGDNSDKILINARAWLEGLYEQEQQKIDWTPEYRSRPFGSVACGSDHPIILENEKSKGVEERLPTHIGQPDLCVNTEPLEWIRLGHGPRSSSIEDLIAPLRQVRLEQRNATRGVHPVNDTYEDLLKTLQGWNRIATEQLVKPKNTPSSSQGGSSRELRRVLKERWEMLQQLAKSDQNPRLLDKHSENLLRAIHAYRSETTHFVDQTPYNLMAVMLANQGIADPGLDVDVKAHMIQVMLGEMHLFYRHQYAQERAAMLNEFSFAREQKDWTKVESLQHQKLDFDLKIWDDAGRRVCYDVQSMWNNLRAKTLGEVQDLAVLQAAQKWTVAELLSSPTGILRKKCGDEDAAVERVIRQQLEAIDAELGVIEGSLRAMFHLQKRNVFRVKKMSGLDVDDPELRKIVSERRLSRPDMPQIMTEVAMELGDVKEKSAYMLRRLEILESSLQTAQQAAQGREKDDHAALDMLNGKVE